VLLTRGKRRRAQERGCWVSLPIERARKPKESQSWVDDIYYLSRHSIFPDNETYLKGRMHKFWKDWFHVFGDMKNVENEEKDLEMKIQELSGVGLPGNETEIQEFQFSAGFVEATDRNW
jgi:hypothetical protein